MSFRAPEKKEDAEEEGYYSRDARARARENAFPRQRDLSYRDRGEHLTSINNNNPLDDIGE